MAKDNDLPVFGGLEIIDITHHRNGVCGMGFYTVLFRATRAFDSDKDVAGRKFLATVFGYVEESASDYKYRRDCLTAVVAVDTLDIEAPEKWGILCWRGDNFHEALWEAITSWSSQEARAARMAQQ